MVAISNFEKIWGEIQKEWLITGVNNFEKILWKKKGNV